MKKKNRPVIETLINGAALILITTGTQSITAGNLKGYAMVVFGVVLEFGKYWGRKQDYW